MAWQLNLGFLGMNGAFVATTYAIGAFEKQTPPTLLLYIVLGVAALLNLLAYFTFERSKIHRNARLIRA